MTGPPRHSTFEPHDWDILSHHWYPVAVAAELGNRPAAACLLDVGLVLFRADGKVVAALDRCPHRGVLLSLGWVDCERLVCPYHGLHFNANGRCTAIPSQPDARIPNRLSLTVFPAVERYGLIWMSLAAGESAVLPAFEAWDDSGFQGIVCPTVEDTPTGCRVEYSSTVSNFPPEQRSRAPADFLWRRRFEVYPPFAARLVVDYPDEKQLWILNAASPTSARKTRLFRSIARNFDQGGSIEAVREFNLKVFNEDRILVEAQRPEDLPLNLALEVHIAADRTSIAYRRLLKKMALSLAYTG